MIWVRAAIFFILLLILLSVNLYGQDIGADEYSRYQVIREQLIREGFLEVQLPQTTLKSAVNDAIITESWYSGISLPITTINSRSTDISNDGTRFYVLGRGSGNVVEYHLAEPWALESAFYKGEFDITNEAGSGNQPLIATHGLFFRKDDGVKMWIVNRSEIWEYTLSIPWDVTSASQTGYRDLSDLLIRAHDLHFTEDGTLLFIDDRLFGAIFQFRLSEPWDISTINLDYVLDISDQQQEVRGIQLNPEGNRMFLMDTARQEILEYYLTNPFDLRSANFVNFFSVSTEIVEPRGVTFRPNFKQYYVTSTLDDTIYQYMILVVDPDVSTISASEEVLKANGLDSSTITITLLDQDEDAIPYQEVELRTDGESSQIENIQKITDYSGIARFRVASTIPGNVTYRATVLREGEDLMLNSTITLSYLPGTPVALSATDVEERSFTANWEMVTNADSYFIDISTDSTFSSFLPGYDGFDTGQVTKFSISGLSPGKTYFYRIRASANGAVGKNSDVIVVDTFPDQPVILPPEDVIATKFSARWLAAEGANGYKIDVAKDQAFSDIVPGYDNVDVGNRLIHIIEGLYPGTPYYFRVRSVSNSRVSISSKTQEVETLQVSYELSEIESSQLRILANGIQQNFVTFILRDTDARVIKGEKISLIPLNGHSNVESENNITNEDGKVFFVLTNTVPEIITYRAVMEGSIGITDITLEFLPDAGELLLGNNFPNPFMYTTTIPVTVPSPMNVRIEIYNAVGERVKIVTDEVYDTGYHEIMANLQGLGSGVYFYRLFANNEVITEKMIYLR